MLTVCSIWFKPFACWSTYSSNTICSTEYSDLQFQKPDKGQQKYHTQSYHHQELSLLTQSDLTEHTKLNNVAESQSEWNI